MEAVVSGGVVEAAVCTIAGPAVVLVTAPSCVLHFTPIAGRYHDISSVKGVPRSSFQLKQKIHILELPADIISI